MSFNVRLDTSMDAETISALWTGIVNFQHTPSGRLLSDLIKAAHDDAQARVNGMICYGQEAAVQDAKHKGEREAIDSFHTEGFGFLDAINQAIAEAHERAEKERLGQ